MKGVLIFALGLLITAVLDGATIATGCVTDANGRPVAGAHVFASPERGEKTYRAQTRKSDGCYEMKIDKDGVYAVGVRDLRFGADGPVQRYMTVAGLDLPEIDLSTDVPNARLLTQRVSDAVLSASEGFARVRRGLSGGDVPVITAEVPSGFGSCMLQSSNDQNGPTAMWWCATGGGFGGIRDEKAAHVMFESIRESITTSLGNLGQLRYSLMKSAGARCENCVDQAVWTSPINGAVALRQTKFKKRNALVLWAAYNSPMTAEGCAAIQKNEEPNIDFARYDSAVNAMRGEYERQVNAAMKAELRNLFGALAGGPAFIGSAQQSGLTGRSVVSLNACLTTAGGASPPIAEAVEEDNPATREFEFRYFPSTMSAFRRINGILEVSRNGVSFVARDDPKDNFQLPCPDISEAQSGVRFGKSGNFRIVTKMKSYEMIGDGAAPAARAIATVCTSKNHRTD